MKKYFFLWSFLCLFSTAFAQPHEHTTTPSNIRDKGASHGMLLMGTDVFYVSHLGMFGGPHNYQGIFRVKLDAASAKLFQKDQANHPEYTTYTISPLDTFNLPEMVAKPRLFKAALFRGHFERGGEMIAQSIEITIEKVVLFKKFDLTGTRDAVSKYMVFGSGKERFVAHLISHKPDFDQIIQIKTALAEGTQVTLNDASNTVVGVSGNSIFKDKKLLLTLFKQLYLEFADFE
jgi:hypothetical protein